MIRIGIICPSEIAFRRFLPALKETAETEYWIRLLSLSDYLDEAMSKLLLQDCLEIKRILIASINTAKDNND